MNQGSEDLKRRLDEDAIAAHDKFVNEGYAGLKKQKKYWTLSKKQRDKLDNEESKLLHRFDVDTYRRPIRLTMGNSTSTGSKTQTYGFHGKTSQKSHKSSNRTVSKRKGGNKNKKNRKSRRR